MSLEIIHTSNITNLIINCIGDPNYHVIWGIKLDGLSI